MDTRTVENDTKPKTPRVRQSLRAVLIAVGPSLIAFAIEMLFLGTVTRWLLFTTAVFVSSWLGGLKSGIAATILSTALVWWYLLPPNRHLGTTDYRYILTMVTFAAIGITISVLHERLRRTTGELAIALAESRRANEALRQTARERRVFAALVENSPDFIGVADPTGKPVYVNPGGRRMVELPADLPIEATKLSEFYAPDARDFASEVIVKDVAEKGEWSGETRFRNWRTGDAIRALATHFMIDDPETGQVIGMATITRDISELARTRDQLEAANGQLHQAAKDLRESQEILQAVIDNSPGMIAVKDLKGKLLLFNRQFRLAIGASNGDLHGRMIYDLFPPDVARRRRAADEAAIKAGKPVTLEESVDLKDGKHVFLATVFPVRDERRNTFGVCWIETDITERKEAEESLARTAADLNEAQRVAHIGSWSWDAKTDVVSWSDELYRIHGRDPKLPPPRYEADYPGLYTPESMKVLQTAVEKVKKDGTAFDLELETIRPDGSTRWIAARGEVVRDASGQLVGVSGTSQDITQVKELQRMKEEWTSVIAHDLRQPIGVIKMSAELLPDLHTGKMAENEAAITARIRSASNSLARMVDDLLDVSRIEANRLSLEQEWVDPRALVREIVERLSHVTTGNTVRVVEEGAPPRVFVDPGRVEQVLGNLISNGVKYGEKNGEILVRVKQGDVDVEISVINRGPGINPEEAARLFTRFGRSKTTHGSGVSGLGLGLYIANGLVEAHGGRMWVDSVPGETTAFHFTLPVRKVMKAAA